MNSFCPPASTTASGRKGSAIVIALGLGFVLLIVIASLRSFTSYRVQNTIMENRNLKALALAEAGISFAMTELSLNSSFRTHKVKIDSAQKQLVWDNDNLPEWQPSIANDSDFSFAQQNTSGKGSYQGTLGDGQFRFRVGLVEYEDDERTKNIDESKCFFKIDSMGRVGDTMRSISCVAQRRFPGREFLMFDMEFLSIVYGEPGQNNVNKFSTGNLYGHNGVEIGQILMDGHSPCTPGTKQELFDMHSIISGAGGIFFWQPTKVTFRARPGMPEETVTMPQSNIPFPQHGTYSSGEGEKYGEVPEEIRGKTPTIPDTLKEKLKGRLLDKNSQISLSPGEPRFGDLKKQAQNGGYIPENDGSNPAQAYKVPAGWAPSSGNSVDARILDFGTGLRKGNVTLPANFNGVIYSDTNLVIKGNPPRDVNIVSKKSVFVAGDFNQRNNKSKKEEKYSFPQDYEQNALLSDDYKENSRKLLTDDLNAGTNPDDPGNYKHHFAAKVIANERVVYDYRSPADCFENEMYPVMKFALAKEFMPAADAETSMLTHAGDGKITADLSDKEATKNKIASYFEKFPLADERDDVPEKAQEQTIAQKFADKFNTADGVSEADFEKFCNEELWPAHRAGYEAYVLSENNGVYKLFNKLLEKVEGKPDKDDDYLYFPEMTTNGIFQSCGVRSNIFYMGPDYSKRYDEIGRSPSCQAAGVGRPYCTMEQMVHRLYGSEVRYATNKTLARITGPSYRPPTRRKLYDPTLPSLDIGDASGDMAAFVILTWKDLRAAPDEFTNF